MTDILDRLHQWADLWDDPEVRALAAPDTESPDEIVMCRDAAAEIERLRADNKLFRNWIAWRLGRAFDPDGLAQDLRDYALSKGSKMR